MRGIRIKFTDFEHRILMALLDKAIKDTKMPTVADACQSIKSKFDKKVGNKIIAYVEQEDVIDSIGDDEPLPIEMISMSASNQGEKVGG